MYRRCIFCGWGRKECLEHIKFFCIPKEGTLQRLQWMNTVGEKRKDGFKKVDSVCSIHFSSGKPSNDPSHVDFAPHLNLDTKHISEDLRTKSLRHYTQESDEVHDLRENRLRQIKRRMEIMRRHLQEPEDAWKARKAQRRQMREQQGEEVPDRYFTELDPARIPPPLFPMNTDENEDVEIEEEEMVPRAPKRRKVHGPRKVQALYEHPQPGPLTPEYDIATYSDDHQDYRGVEAEEIVVDGEVVDDVVVDGEVMEGEVIEEEVIAEEVVEEEEEPISIGHDPEPVYQYQQQARVVSVRPPHRAMPAQPVQTTAYIRAQDSSFTNRPCSSRHVFIPNSRIESIER